MDAARERERASDAIPALLANLSGQLRIYHFQLKEKRLEGDCRMTGISEVGTDTLKEEKF